MSEEILPSKEAPRVSVLMPSYGQAHFIARALDSLLAQSLPDWEAIIVDDGADQATRAAIAPFLADRRMRCLRRVRNGGLGAALNMGLAAARAELVAYLPSDDVMYRDHLARLVGCLADNPDAVLAFSGLRHHYNRYADGQLAGSWLQLVQCLHRATALRWTERAVVESDDLERLFWGQLRALGPFAATGQVSCEWVDHPMQRHKLMQEPVGGINLFRQYYRVAGPLRFHTSCGNAIDESAQFHVERARRATPASKAGLKIVLAGELAYNADRVLALEEQGHQLYGLWMRQPYWYNTVGPLPFGHVTDLPADGWRDALARFQPDVIYAQLNWQAVPFAHEVMMASAGIPFVWHFKEGPFICLEKGTWPLLVELFQRADGCISAVPKCATGSIPWCRGCRSAGPAWCWTATCRGAAGSIAGARACCRRRTARSIPWCPGGRSACIQARWPSWRIKVCTCISTAISRRANGARGSSAPRRWRRGTCTCTPMWSKRAGCKNFPATTPAGCMPSRAATAGRSGAPTGTT
jgi:hypothetical protein